MVPLDYSFTDAVIELVREGALSESRLDASVRRILTMKRDLGLFDAPGPAFNAAPRDRAKERALSLRAARESIVLLRNPGSLPLASDAKVLVTGPGADSAPMLHGAWTWTWQGKDPAAYPADAATVVSELRRQLGAHRVAHSPNDDLADARKADVLIAVVGEQPSVEKPGDIEDLALERSQIDLVARCVATGKPTVVVLLQGRPRLINEIAKSAALIHAGLPGPEGARAIGEILAGTVNPSGKLPFTYPRHAGSLVPYDHKESDRFDKNFGQDAFQPLFPFGHGLSYTSFAYSDLTCSPNAMTDDEPIVISVTVKNTGARTGRVPVLLFIRDDFASVTPPVKRLRGFDTLTLDPGVSARISFPVTSTDLAFVDRDLNWTTEPGTFRAFVGDQDAAFSFSRSR